jgi:hypothetical protein
MRKFSAIVAALALIFLAAATGRAANPLKPSKIFAIAQRCHVNGTTDYGCFQSNAAIFEAFVLSGDATWLQKFLVADGLVHSYAALKFQTAGSNAVKAKQAVYLQATQTLDKSELGQIDDCRDEASPDACLKGRYCFKEGFIKIKNVLVANDPKLFAKEIDAFDREIAGNC